MATIWLTGSPANRNIENEMIPTAIMTPIAWIARRRVKASIGFFHLSVESRTHNAKRKIPGQVPPGL
jgi:hypothetical protein